MRPRNDRPVPGDPFAEARAQHGVVARLSAEAGRRFAALAMVWIAPAGGLTAASLHAMMVRTIREAAMLAQALAHAIPLDGSGKKFKKCCGKAA